MKILRQSDIEDLYDVIYFPGEKYSVYIEVRDMEFGHKNIGYMLQISAIG